MGGAGPPRAPAPHPWGGDLRWGFGLKLAFFRLFCGVRFIEGGICRAWLIASPIHGQSLLLPEVVNPGFTYRTAYISPHTKSKPSSSP